MARNGLEEPLNVREVGLPQMESRWRADGESSATRVRTKGHDTNTGR
jgi:hypothetical protein